MDHRDERQKSLCSYEETALPFRGAQKSQLRNEVVSNATDFFLRRFDSSASLMTRWRNQDRHRSNASTCRYYGVSTLLVRRKFRNAETDLLVIVIPRINMVPKFRNNDNLKKVKKPITKAYDFNLSILYRLPHKFQLPCNFLLVTGDIVANWKSTAFN